MLPFYIGLVVSLLELFLVPRKEVKVRFHASQALALHIAILIVHTLFGVIRPLRAVHLAARFSDCGLCFPDYLDGSCVEGRAASNCAASRTGSMV